MNVIITTHQVHHEYKRWLELGKEKYISRVIGRVKLPEKQIAVLVFLAYQVYFDESLISTIRIIGDRIQAAGIQEFAVVESRKHECLDKVYRLDEFVKGMRKVLA